MTPARLLPTALTVLAFTTPTHDAWPDSVPCAESIAPVGKLGTARLYRLGEPAPEQSHAALAPGARDSFSVSVPSGEMRTYYVTVAKASGVESCRSNYVTINGQLDVPQAPVAGQVRFYDVLGRERKEPLPVGIYWKKEPGQKARKVVVIR
jgi:hypothetical protein